MITVDALTKRYGSSIALDEVSLSSPRASPPRRGTPPTGIPLRGTSANDGQRQEGSVSETTYVVVGMTCDHCAAAVTREIGAVPGVANVEVDLAGGQVRVSSNEPVDEAAVRAAVEEAGYELAPG